MKKIWISLSAFGLALSMTTVGLVGANESAFLSKADSGHTWGLIGSFSENSWGGDVATSSYDEGLEKDVLSYTISEGTAFKIRADSAWVVSIGGLELTQSRTEGDTYFTNTDGNAVVNTGYTGLYTFYLLNGVYDYEDKSYGVTVTYTAVSEYTVSEYAVVDGVLEGSSFATETAYSTSNFTPTNVLRTNYYIAGWYTDAACTTSYTATTLSSNTDLYCKYQTVTSSPTTVYFTNTGWDNTYVYSFGGQNQFGNWPGAQITTLTNGATLNGIGAVYKAELHSEYGDDHVIFNDGTGGTAGVAQTNNMVVTADACYQLNDANEATGNIDLGSAAAVVYDINYYRCNVVASGSILEDSVCGIGKNDAASLIASYDALNATAKAYVDNSTDYTYNYQDTAGSAIDISYVDIIAQLRLLAVDGSSSSTILSGVVNSNPAIILAILFSTISAVGIATYFIIRKKKALDQR